MNVEKEKMNVKLELYALLKLAPIPVQLQQTDNSITSIIYNNNP